MHVDYRALGLRCGLECHQQLDTGKLFSRTPSALREDGPHFTVERRLRPAASEMGEIDSAALEAFGKGISYVYEGYTDTISLVELDEEPPQPIDRQALGTVLQIAMMCNSSILDEVFVMRKLVIDGSNTSGFQRTALVAMGGEIALKAKKLGIQTIVAEEDAARPMKKTGGKIHYRLDRLGIPLLELATEPGIETPEEAKEAARAIGTLFRLTGKVKRGLGTIRQDLNVSIRGGARVEIKGVQELEIIDEYVRREVGRQHGLLEIRKLLAERGLGNANLRFAPKDLTAVFASTSSGIVKGALANGEKVFGMRLEKFKGIISKELQPGRRLGTEFADYVRTKTGLGGIFHSDEMPNYGITQEEAAAAAQGLGCAERDAFVLVAATEERAVKALRVVFERAQQCIEGTPEETRGAVEGGNTEYLRPLPGAARMYPETDLEPVTVTPEMLKQAQKGLPLSAEQREKLYTKWGLAEKHVQEMKTSNYARMFEGAVRRGADARKTASFLLEGLVEARREGAPVEGLDEDALYELIMGISMGKITREIQKQAVLEKSRNPRQEIDAILSGLGAKSAGPAEVERVVAALVKRNEKLVREQGGRALGPLMGDAMAELKGKVSGKAVSELLSREIKKLLG